MAARCFGPEKLKKDDDASDRKVQAQKSWQTSLLFAVTALIALVGLYASVRSKQLFDANGFMGDRSLLYGTSQACEQPKGMYIHPNRALAMLNITKWQMRNISQNVFPDGFPVHHYESSQSNVWELARKQWWESETFRVASTIIRQERKGKPNATVLDIGGWIGITGLYYSTHAPRVVAVEPDITARSELVANVALNPALEPRIRVYDKCISNKKGELIMKGDPGGSWSSILFHNDKTLPSWKVECVTFETFLEIAEVKPEDIVFIKMDIEGAEHTVLPHMRKWLRRHGNPPIWVSMHKWLWEAGDDAKNRMAASFRDYAHVYNGRLEEIPRANLEDGVTFFGDTSDSVYLLSMKTYKFVDLRTSDFGDHGSVIDLPVDPIKRKKKALRVEELDEEESTTTATDTEEADDDGEEQTEEMTTDTEPNTETETTETETEPEPEPEPPRRRRRSSRSRK